MIPPSPSRPYSEERAGSRLVTRQSTPNCFNALPITLIDRSRVSWSPKKSLTNHLIKGNLTMVLVFALRLDFIKTSAFKDLPWRRVAFGAAWR